ncbi:glycosyltransferase family 4 protein [Nocardioides bizhenqiangii]|uniref:Glycosyltransferase family 4 protein n=1 Tax=Nocardioides bizhenqiangii TaxID=3095076 RepID=A0ABZ0ZSB0_9ACTN|nr:glycosyltransferase family 4 protein [Nocardioides sp. HM61]WQQ26779.1 glycosyltransferase family 4 protein [Nocardioides sp. HM61]
MTCAPIEFVVPAGIDDPARPSGGNHYDRRVIESLTAMDREVHEHRVGDVADLGPLLAGLPDGAVVVLDGLLGSAAPGALEPVSGRLRVVVLLHMPFAEAATDESVRRSERAALAAASGVVTTSDWARGWVVRHHGLPTDRVSVAKPGVDPAPVSWAFPPGGRLMCLAAVTQDKGHDTLVAALAQIADLDWVLTCVGATDLEPDFVAELADTAQGAGIGDRVEFTGPLTGDPLGFALDNADLLVSASRRESFGMAVTEALARGVPVVVTDVGGHSEAVGGTTAGERAGVLVPPDDPDRLAAALRCWLTDRDHRERLRAAARDRRTTLASWEDTARLLAAVVDATPLEPIVVRDTTRAAR